MIFCQTIIYFVCVSHREMSFKLGDILDRLIGRKMLLLLMIMMLTLNVKLSLQQLSVKESVIFMASPR